MSNCDSPLHSSAQLLVVCDDHSAVHEEKLAAVRDGLLSWYGEHRRDLPWRGVADPYAVVVSEIMLQQTGVERVIPKYQAFLRRFPSFVALAAAPRDEVIRAWSGLGYNRRAVQLHRLAQIVVERHAGALPATATELRALPGIGPYTAGAVASFVFGQDVPALDTNAGRTLGRIFCGQAEHNLRRLFPLAQRLIPPGRSADFNQAVMDFASLQCTRVRPACLLCPVLDWCLAAPRAQTGGLVERRVAETGEPYLFSARYYRGRIVALLRDLPSEGALDLEEIRRLLSGETGRGADPPERRWLQGLVAGLLCDGLVAEDRGGGAPRYRLAR